MKVSALLAVGAASGSYAQSYSTVTFVECTSQNDQGVTYTSTNTITSTYCSECEMSATPTPTGGGNTVHTTVYPVTYVNACPTGYITQTFTVTESCTGATPTFSGPGNSGYIPPGFTTAYVPCHVCESTPVTNVMTFPITQGPTAPIPSPSETAAPGGGSSPPPGTGSGGAGGSATTPLGGANTTGLAPYNPNSGDRIIVGVSTSAALVFALFALFL